MTPRRQIIIFFARVLLVLAVLALLARYAMTPREPEYGGKKLSQWLDKYSIVTGNYDGVDQAILAMGTNTLPFLWRDLNAHDSPAITRLNDFLNRQTFIRIYRPSDGVRLHRAVNAIRALGSTAGPLVPDLIRWLPDTNRNQLAGHLLYAIGPAALLPLTQASQEDPNPYLRLHAAITLQDISKNSSLLYEVVADSLAPSQPRDLRLLAFNYCLYPWPQCPDPECAPNPLLVALIACLHDPDATIQKEAAYKLGDYHSVAIPFLEKIIADKTKDAATIEAAAQDVRTIRAAFWHNGISR